jgi:hypothetical protein
MALIKCYECSKEISDIAEACPHCGAVKTVECHECSKQISKGLNKCPHCGAPEVHFVKINNRITKFILLSLTIFFGFWVWYFLILQCYINIILWDFNTEDFLINLFPGLICTALTFYLPYHAFYKLSKNKKETSIKTYKVNSIGWMRLHIILCLIPTAISFLLAAVTDEYWNETGWFINLHPDTNYSLSNHGWIPSHYVYEVAFFTSICSFVLYWIVVGLIVWIKKGFKE